MIRALIALALKVWVAQRLPRTGAALVDAALDGFAELMERGDSAVVVHKAGERQWVTIRPADPGARKNTLDDILKSENNPV